MLILFNATMRNKYTNINWSHCFNKSSRSNTDFSSLINIVVRLGNCEVGVLCAVTRAGCKNKVFEFALGRSRTNERPSRTASTIPAVKDEQLNWLMSRGTEIWRSMGGSLSMIISVHLSDLSCCRRAD